MQSMLACPSRTTRLCERVTVIREGVKADCSGVINTGPSSTQPSPMHPPTSTMNTKSTRKGTRYFQTEADPEAVGDYPTATMPTLFPARASFVPLSSAQPVVYGTVPQPPPLWSATPQIETPSASAGPLLGLTPPRSLTPTSLDTGSSANVSASRSMATQPSRSKHSPNVNSSIHSTPDRRAEWQAVPPRFAQGNAQTNDYRSRSKVTTLRPAPYPTSRRPPPVAPRSGPNAPSTSSTLPSPASHRLLAMTRYKPIRSVNDANADQVSSLEPSSAFFCGAFAAPMSFHVLAPFTLRRKLVMSITVCNERLPIIRSTNISAIRRWRDAQSGRSNIHRPQSARFASFILAH